MTRWFTRLLGLALLAAPLGAHAQSATPTGFALDRFEPAARGSNFFGLDTLDLRGDMRPAAGVTLDLGYKPLVAYDLKGNDVADIVKLQLFAHLGGSLVISDRVRLALNLPIVLANSGDTTTVNGVSLPAPSSAAVGDPRVSADVRLLGVYGEPFTAAFGADVWLPIGSQAQYASDGKLRFEPHLLASGTIAEMFQYSARLGYQYRGLDSTVAGTALGSQLDFGAAAGVRPIPELIIGPELYGSTVVSSSATDLKVFGKDTTPVELVLGGHYQAGDFKFGAGAGPGLSRGMGSPQVRGLLSFEWAPAYVEPVHDRDLDGVPDEQDACPDQAGIKTADPKTNGCPDKDKDGVVDALDACPDVAGVATNDPKTNGCPPPPPDRDGDGIPDNADACPDQKGVASKDPKKNGCPPDLDNDGIPDTEDACPDVPGVKTNDPKTNGCPSDRDHDGIPDAQDACPDEAGIPELKGCPDKDTDKDGVPDRFDNCPMEPGPKENGGCPVKQKQLVVITKEKLEIKDKVYFDTNKSTIQKKSNALLDQIANVIKTHPNITKIRVEGHTDNTGKADHNRKLSQQRADAVKKYLVKKGVEASRLETQGFGPDKPIDDNNTEAGRANNRRVEFVIVEQKDEAPAPEQTPPTTPAPPQHK